QAALDDALCTDFTVNTSAGTVRTAPSVDASQVINLPFGTTVCVTGVVPFLENDWFIVRVPNTEDEIVQAFMAQSVLNSTDEILPTPTPSPVGSTSQVTTDNAGVAVAQPTVCPAGASAEDCAAVQTEDLQIVGDIQSIDLPLINTSTNDNIILQSPQGNATFRFFYPEDWASNGNDVLVLNFDYFELNRGTDSSLVDPISLLDITVNDQLVQSLALDLDNVGQNTLTIPLPAAQMQDREQRSHSIGFTLTALDHCREDLTARVEFDTSSSFVSLRYNELEPTLNLAEYPRPFYEQHASGTEIVYVVIPDTPSSEELTAAGRIVAGLGSIAEQLIVRTTTVSQLSDIEYVTNNLILIGLAGNHALIDSLYAQNALPTSIDDEGNIIRNDAPVLEEDGVVQIIQHPIDPRFAILSVTGQTPVAIAKAGQLLAGNPPLIGLGGDVAIVSGISDA
ncbi:MAG: cellulose biosynthesis cyclic di-GMP-binding regulatory protein BcsB, partial [Chloroflexota bacterium]